MNDLDQPVKRALALFILAALFTFGFITLLQFAPMPWFFLVLVAMHIGIALFIISKRSFKKFDLEVSQFYKTQYLLLLPYLLVMLYTFTSRAGLVPLLTDEKTAFVLFYSSLCALITIWNYIRLTKSLQHQVFEHGENAAVFVKGIEQPLH